jgi:hypothetical protein
MDGQQVLDRVFSNVGAVCLQDGMQKVRGSNSLSSTNLSDIRSNFKRQAGRQRGHSPFWPRGSSGLVAGTSLFQGLMLLPLTVPQGVPRVCWGRPWQAMAGQGPPY